jgi:hypothetical protein
MKGQMNGCHRFGGTEPAYRPRRYDDQVVPKSQKKLSPSLSMALLDTRALPQQAVFTLVSERSFGVMQVALITLLI